ncbi:hypothetical protein [Iodobacter fluviatilis]|uniref:hypothetical protein n=1 Tax=Iodobacter fluviatilis TaxID=537 RepID=UPI00165E37DA|nr:hypothetical protein [Iodobacter fluviatilis]
MNFGVDFFNAASSLWSAAISQTVMHAMLATISRLAIAGADSCYQDLGYALLFSTV